MFVEQCPRSGVSCQIGIVDSMQKPALNRAGFCIELLPYDQEGLRFVTWVLENVGCRYHREQSRSLAAKEVRTGCQEPVL